jgi:Arc/MetJ-type ribon-helix-helix transcriptional regulator
MIKARLIHVKLPEKMVERMDERVLEGRAATRTELIRMAVVRYLDETGARA